MWKNKKVGYGMGIILAKVKARLSPLDTPTKDKLRVCYVGEDYHMYLPNVSSRSTSTYNAYNNVNVPITNHNNFDKDFCNNYNDNACDRDNIDANKDTNVSNIDTIKDTNISPIKAPNKPYIDTNIDPNNIYKGSSACACMRVYETNKGKSRAEIFGDRREIKKTPGNEFNLENFVLYCREYVYTGAFLHTRNPKAKSFNYEALSFYNNKDFNILKVKKSFGSIGFNGEVGICPAGDFTYIYIISDSMWLSYYVDRFNNKKKDKDIGMCEVWADYNRRYMLHKLLNFFNIRAYTILDNVWVGKDIFGNDLNFDYHTGLGKVCIVSNEKEILLYSGKGKDVICKADGLDKNAKLEGKLTKLFTYNYNNNIQYEYDNKVKHYKPKDVRQHKSKEEIFKKNIEKGKLKPRKEPKGKNAPSLKKNPRHDKYHYVPVRNNPYHLTSIKLQHRRERLKRYFESLENDSGTIKKDT